MRITRLKVTGILAVLALTFVLTLAGCGQSDPKVMVTPFVAKAPQPPPAATQPASPQEPGTRMYEQAVMGK
jgi:hypothetical protein